MTKIIFVALTLLFSTVTFSQVGLGTINPDNSAQLDVYSTSKGFLMPRLTETQRDAIVKPAVGLLIFNTTANQLQTNTGTTTAPIWSTNANLTGAITSVGNATALGSFRSSDIATALTDETGTGSVVLADSPTFSGIPTVPAPSSDDSSLQIANTQFVTNAVKTPLAIKTSNYILDSKDHTILCNASSAGFSLTLPAAADSENKIIIIKKIDTSNNAITFSTSVYLTDSETATSINYPKTIKIQSNGVNWYIIN